MSARKESTIGWLIYGGLALIPVGIGILWVFTLGGLLRFMNSKGTDASMWSAKGLGFFIIGLGAIMAVAGLMIGSRAGKIATRGGSGRVVIAPCVQVVARFGLDDRGEQIYDDYQFEACVRPKFLVKLRHSDGSVMEYYTRLEIWAKCGEGMWGEARFDGGWLGSFEPRVGPG